MSKILFSPASIVSDSVKFGKANGKLKKLAPVVGCAMSHIVQFDLPAGWSCPKADICKSKYNPQTGQIIDGKDCKFRCYAIKAEVQYPKTAPFRWANFNALKGKSAEQMAAIILSEIKLRTRIVRIHSSGDFFNAAYFAAWVMVAKARPDVIFFGYTKVAAYVREQKPTNFHLTYSHGGLDDSIAKDLPTCYVALDDNHAVQIAKDTGAILCCEENQYDDYLAILAGKSFILKVH